MAVVAGFKTGSSVAEVNAFGPVQLYVAPATVFAVKFSAFPLQTGVLLLITGSAGVAFTVAVPVAVAEVHPLATTYRL